MPDRLPPSWGREPEDGRDLDVLLSAEDLVADEALLLGQMTGISESRRPVAGAMFALRAAPVPSELGGEAAARAAFRAELYRTLVLPVPVVRQGRGYAEGQRPPARHRHRRRAAAGRGGWRVMATVGSAAAAVAIGAAALAGTFSGAHSHGGQPAGSSAAGHSSQAGPAASQTGQSVLGRGQATRDPTPTATPKASATPGAPPSHGVSPRHSALCRQYFSYAYPLSPKNRDKEEKVVDELSKIVGTKSPLEIVGYCVQQVGPWWDTHGATPSSWQGVPYSGGGDRDGHAGQGGPGQAGPGSAPSGDAGNGGQGGSSLGGSGSGYGGTR